MKTEAQKIRIREYGKAYRKAHLAYYRQKNKESYARHLERRRLLNRNKNRAWREKNPELARAKWRAERKRLWKTNPQFRLKSKLASYLCRKLNGSKKVSNTLSLLGCSLLDLRRHLELLFQPGMSWKNYGLYGWHIDHKRPCASFDLTDPAQQKQCFHYTNLQPLWAKDNLSKSDKILA